MDVKDVVQYIKWLQKENPNQIIVVEMPDYHAEMHLGDILIYEGMRGEIIFDNE